MLGRLGLSCEVGSCRKSRCNVIPGNVQRCLSLFAYPGTLSQLAELVCVPVNSFALSYFRWAPIMPRLKLNIPKYLTNLFGIISGHLIDNGFATGWSVCFFK